MLRKVACGVAVVALGSSLMFAHQGNVTPSGDRTYADTAPPPATPESILKDVRDGLKKLDAARNRDVGIRIEMAKQAISSQAWEAAREALDDAARIEPKNAEVASLMASIRPKLPLPATVPATNPAAIKPPVPVVPAPRKAPVGSYTAIREVTPAEVNRIKQKEWENSDEQLPIRIDAATKKKFLAENTDISPGDFNKMSVDEQAHLILTKGKPELYKGVNIVQDPASVANFKKSVGQIVSQSCATAGCHTGSKAGAFVLYPGTSATAVYSNFLILQKYSTRVKKVERALVDRGTPESSLLLQFLLDRSISDAPHPEVPNFRPPLRRKDDARYTKILQWIQGLGAISPHYGIDLTTEEDAGKESTKPAKPPGNTPPGVFGK